MQVKWGCTMSENLAGYQAFYGVLISIVRPAVVILILYGFWAALKRSTLTPQSRAATWLAVAIPLFAWLVLIWTIAAAGFFSVGRVPSFDLRSL